MSTEVTHTAVDIELYRVEATIEGDCTYHEIHARADQPPVLEKWTYKSDIDTGAQAWVTLEENENGSLRAVKGRMARGFIKDKSRHRELLREIQNLIAVLDFKSHFTQLMYWYMGNHEVYIAMEYAQYGNLKEYLIKKPELKGEVFAKEVAKQVLQGLEVLHNSGICHRDLKPQNILVHDEVPLHVKLADFGISKSEIDTQLRTMTGTIGYYAPEIYSIGCEASNYTNSVDIWSLGCVLYEIMTSRTPFSDRWNHFSRTLLETYIECPDSFIAEFMGENYGYNFKEFLLNLLAPDPKSLLVLVLVLAPSSANIQDVLCIFGITQLKDHERGHFSPYECRICGEIFIQDRTLKKHIMREHSNAETITTQIQGAGILPQEYESIRPSSIQQPQDALSVPSQQPNAQIPISPIPTTITNAHLLARDHRTAELLRQIEQLEEINHP